MIPMTLAAHVHGGGLSYLVNLVAHAVIWSAVSRLIRHAPVWVVVCAVVLAAAVFLLGRAPYRSRRSGRLL